MLKQRVITALVLLAVVLAALFAPGPAAFTALALAGIGAAAWEWARLNGWAGGAAVGFGALVSGICAALWCSGTLEHDFSRLWQGAAIAWVACGAWLLARGVSGWPRVPGVLRLGLGLVMLVVAWLAIAAARRRGINFLLSSLMLVWAADVFAYFFGRALGGRLTGGRKLAPAISPGKSWEGVWGGWLGVLLVAVVWMAIDRRCAVDSASLYSVLHDAGWWALALGALVLAAMSVVGDLIESLVKRAAGAKDSSRLLPGHGGVLDRIDALLPTMPLAMALASLVSGAAA